MDIKDIIQIGKLFVYISFPMTILMIFQFYSPQSSFVNIGIGGDSAGSGFGGTEDYFRPSGMFSFTSGLVNYYSLLAPFIFYFLIYNKTVIPKFINYSAVACLLVSIPFSISRTLFFSVAITFLFILISFRKQGKVLGQLLGAMVICGAIIYVLIELNLLGTSIDAFTTRFTDANEVEGGAKGVFVDRLLGGLVYGIIKAFNGETPFLGVGLGMGTNAGAKLLTGDNTKFLVAEVELGRIVGEMGLLIGLIYIFIRLKISVQYLIIAFKKIQQSNPLPWLLMSFSFLQFFQGQTNNPTNLGFVVIGAGLTIAAINDSQLNLKSTK